MKRFTISDIKVLTSAAEVIHKRPSMFFEGGVPTAERLVSSILEDVADAGAVAEVRQHGEWTMVCAGIDWMANARAPFDQLFKQFVLPNRNVPNSHRAEVLVAATCRKMLTTGEAGTFAIAMTADDIPADLPQTFQSTRRAILWAM